MIMMMMIRLELHTENSKPQLVFMDQIEEIGTDLVTVTFSSQLSFDGAVCLMILDGDYQMIIIVHVNLGRHSNIFQVRNEQCVILRTKEGETSFYF